MKRSLLFFCLVHSGWWTKENKRAPKESIPKHRKCCVIHYRENNSDRAVCGHYGRISFCVISDWSDLIMSTDCSGRSQLHSFRMNRGKKSNILSLLLSCSLKSHTHMSWKRNDDSTETILISNFALGFLFHRAGLLHFWRSWNTWEWTSTNHSSKEDPAPKQNTTGLQAPSTVLRTQWVQLWHPLPLHSDLQPLMSPSSPTSQEDEERSDPTSTEGSASSVLVGFGSSSHTQEVVITFCAYISRPSKKRQTVQAEWENNYSQSIQFVGVYCM